MTSQPPDGQPASPPAGWYIDQQHPAQERWWQGTAWTDATRPAQPAGTATRSGFAQWGVVCLLASIAGCCIVLFTNVTLLSGMDQVILGAVITVAGAVVAFITRSEVAFRIICLILAVLAVVGAGYDQHQLDDLRSQLTGSVTGP